MRAGVPGRDSSHIPYRVGEPNGSMDGIRTMTQEIQIARHDGTPLCKVEAQIYGPFAIHRGLNGSEWFTLTHIHTGAAIEYAAPSVQSLLSLARRLVQLDIDWYRIRKFEQRPKRKLLKALAVREQWRKDWGCA